MIAEKRTLFFSFLFHTSMLAAVPVLLQIDSITQLPETAASHAAIVVFVDRPFSSGQACW